MVDVDFSPYLEFVRTSPRYHETLSRYTVTDAIDIVLEAQTVVREEKEGRESREAKQRVERFPVLEGLRKYASHHVLLSGKPGSGKSTTLKRLLLEMAKVALADDDQPIPVLVQLKSDRTVWQSIIEELENGDLDGEINRKYIKLLLRKKRLFLLLDGVNEIPSEELRRELQEFRENNLDTPMIFTTRDLAVGGDFGIEKKLEMTPLTDSQMREFVGKYLPEYRDLLLRQLENRLREVAVTPLLLKMLCEVFDPETRQIPKSKGELFRAFDRKYHQHKQNPPVSGDFRRFQSEVLQYLAWEMMQGDREKPTEAWLRISRQKAEGILESWLGKRQVADAATKAKEWLEDLLEHHLLQVAADGREIEFHHQLFQEYYAAEALLIMVKNRDPDVMDDGRLQHFYLNYLKWREPVALMLGLLGYEAQAVRVVRLALAVDLQLGARLAGEVKLGFQVQTVGMVSGLEIPERLKVRLLKYATPLDKSESNTTIKSQLSCRENVDNHSIKPGFRSSPKYGELCRLIEDPKPEVLWNAMSDLERYGGVEDIPILLNLIDSPDPNVRWGVAHGLLFIGDCSATSGLLRLLQDDSDDVRGSAAIVLGRIRDENSIDGLIDFIKNPSNDIDRAGQLRRFGASALAKIGSQKAVNSLLSLLENSDESVRWYAVDALGDIRDKDAVIGLIKRLRDCSSNIRSKAAYTLGFIADEAVVPELISYLQCVSDKSDDECWSVIDALGEIGSKKAIPELHRFLAKSNSYLKEKAIFALGKIGDESVIPDLIHILQTSNLDSKGTAIEILGKMQAEPAIPYFLDILENDPYVRSRNDIAGVLGGFQRERAAHILPHLLTLIPTKSGEDALRAIANIQENCQFYNYEIFTARLPPVVSPQQLTDNPVLNTLQEINQGVQKMSETPKQDFSGATFSGHVNFAPNQGSQDVTKIGTQNNYATDPKITEALKNITQLLEKLHQQNPQASDIEILDILTKGFQTMPQNNPKQWQSWKNIFSIVFAGGMEAVKMFLPAAGIPIEVGKRLYEIHKDNQQLPGN
ncbi:HEAT repeat domain-containing protein [Limnofasciculus baicalensis]|uniref:HEAT repeat domain-containing protein n=1 Tax=Limnofasciculus baicalensis BBK-W-15 TaxID=2699891 RepID=A0AAE3GRQ9_9CYAN|nr:HEAT repeat domain-containing protein [Limnofasciculus baicalensis]MCP2728736.1 HEAT repeat domain-containing protein [Limnofasciculus baicalensis BBK-W-15]